MAAPRTINDVLTQGNAAQTRLNELYTQITAEINADANLSGLTSTSKTAEFNLWKYVWSAMAYIQEQIWGEAKAEIQAVVDAAIPGTEKWLQKEILKFQYGDALTFDVVTAKYYYAVNDVTKQIIKRCAITSSGGLSTIKVAKESAGVPVALTGPELTAVRSYLEQIKWAGSNAQLNSTNSDKLNANFTIYYNGTIKLTDIQPLVEAAYLNYLKALPFNAEYNITRHIDAMQAVANVNDVVPGVIQAKVDAGTYANIVRVYFPNSGYIERDTTIAFTTMLTYVAQ